MPTSTRFVVSVHMLALMACNAGKPLRSEEIAADVGTNPAVIRALLSRLSPAGLTVSQRGNGGGALLARPATEIRLLDAYLAVEDRDIFTFHRSSPDDGHAVGRYVLACLAAPLHRAREAMEQQLAMVTIQHIVDEIGRRDDASGGSAPVLART